ncbi:MAG TPA: 6-pyruvoyl-tetrahydropterin synthase-related protein [Pyrinomonadaceae bacterium]
MSSRAIQNRETGVFAFTASTKASRLFLVIGISLAVMVPVFIFGVPANRDLSNHFRFALPFYDAITNGNFYPSWLAESNSGYGDPSFRFYPPALYYLLSVSRLLLGNWYAATLVTFAAISVIGGLGIYFWSKSVLPSTTAVLVSFFFALAPYHLNQLYQATLLAEWAGTSLLPFAFGFIERICDKGRRRDIAGLAFVYALLVLTHLPLTVIGSLALFVYALARIQRPHRLKTLVKLGIGIGLGLMASATYWVTMLSEMHWIGINKVDYDASVDYRNNFVLSTFSPDNLNVWWMNIILLMTVLLFAPIVFLIGRRKLVGQGTSRAVLILSAFALFMTLPLSRPLWYTVSSLQQTQFPWRWFALLSMGGSILAAAGLPLLAEADQGFGKVKRMLVVGAMAIAITFTFSHVVREAQFLNKAQFETTISEVRGTQSINYWFPIWANNNPQPMTEKVAASDRTVSITSWEPEHRTFSVNSGKAEDVRVKTFYYPLWTATSAGHQLATRPDKDGALLISVPAETATVKLDFVEPLKSRVSSYASLAGWLFIGGLALPTFRRRRI